MKHAVSAPEKKAKIAHRQSVLDRYMAEHHLKSTSQRDAIIEAAFGTTEHYTAEELLNMARRIDPSVSRATVYRTLPLLVDCGVLKEMDFGKDYKFYDPNYVDHPNHNHLICVDCNKIVEFEEFYDTAGLVAWLGISRQALRTLEKKLVVGLRRHLRRAEVPEQPGQGSFSVTREGSLPERRVADARRR